MKGSKKASTGLKAPIISPSGTPIAAAIRKPPTTRNTVMAMSPAKPNSVSSDQPAASVFPGEARKSGGTQPE